LHHQIKQIFNLKPQKTMKKVFLMIAMFGALTFATTSCGGGEKAVDGKPEEKEAADKKAAEEKEAADKKAAEEKEAAEKKDAPKDGEKKDAPKDGEKKDGEKKEGEKPTDKAPVEPKH